MESTEKLERIEQAIKKLLAENREASPHNNIEDDNDARLLNRLLSELQVLKEGGELKELEEQVNSTGIEEVKSAEEEEIVKEIKQVKRQNVVTHCLVSALIVVTLVWQLSEVSLLLKLKDGFNHPFKSVATLFSGMMASKAADKEEEESDESPPLHLPELPHMPGFGSHDDDNE